MTRSSAVWILVSALAAASCSHRDESSQAPATEPATAEDAVVSTVPDTPGMTETRYENLLEAASASLNCPTEQLQYEFGQTYETNMHSHRVSGCDRSTEFLMVCTGFCTWLESVEATARGPMKCDELETTYVGSFRFDVAGCGQSRRYVMARHTWIDISGD